MGKTFTLDPISKRRLDNFGEEDQFYIRDHHEAIISEETFEKAQESCGDVPNHDALIPTESVKSLAASIHLAVCWNVDFAAVLLQGAVGIAAHSTIR